MGKPRLLECIRYIHFLKQQIEAITTLTIKTPTNAFEALQGQNFSSFEVARKAIDEAGKAEGFSLVIRTKRPNAANPTSVSLCCSKGRKWASQANEAIHTSKRRKTSSQMEGCDFRVITRLYDKQHWRIELPNEPAVQLRMTATLTSREMTMKSTAATNSAAVMSPE